MERITYKCDKAESKKPLAERKNWQVYLGNTHIATISTAEEPSSDRSHTLRIWKAKMNHNAFDPFDFPHRDEGDDEEKTRPHVSLADGTPFLINPQPMTMSEARSWVRQVVQRGSK